MEKKIRITQTILASVASLSAVLGVGFATAVSPDYNSGSYKHDVCLVKVLDFAQKGLIRDVGGFSGGIYECMHMKSANSIYGTI
jgi:hypothetical protein